MTDREQFLEQCRGVFEHSPWVAEKAVDSGAISDFRDTDAIHRAMCAAFRAASREDRLGVLCAHPDLAGRLALAGELTEDSKKEQAGAGLDRLTVEELAEFTGLNTDYVARFGFPFIIAVKGLDKRNILEAFRKRISNDAETEFQTACGQVERIALLRLKSIIAE